jgi:hypothetical protein
MFTKSVVRLLTQYVQEGMYMRKYLLLHPLDIFVARSDWLN